MNINYRPDIDGLRAIAVISVIFYHADNSIKNFKILSGGFVGVDIFFVISGFLITSIILKELINTGSFSFKNFYIRRIKRIIPVLLFVFAINLFDLGGSDNLVKKGYKVENLMDFPGH